MEDNLGLLIGCSAKLQGKGSRLEMGVREPRGSCCCCARERRQGGCAAKRRRWGGLGAGCGREGDDLAWWLPPAEFRRSSGDEENLRVCSRGDHGQVLGWRWELGLGGWGEADGCPALLALRPRRGRGSVVLASSRRRSGCQGRGRTMGEGTRRGVVGMDGSRQAGVLAAEW